MKRIIGLVLLFTLLGLSGCDPDDPTDGDMDSDTEYDVDLDVEIDNPDGDENEVETEAEIEVETEIEEETEMEKELEAELDKEIEVEIDGDEEIGDEIIATGSIIGYAKFHIIRDHDGIDILLIQDSTIIQQTETDSCGNYEFSGLEAGVYSIVASWGDFTEEYYVATDVDVFNNQISVADGLFLTPTGNIEGSVILEGAISGNEGIQIYLAGLSHMARTNDAGNYLISHIPVGTYKLCTDMFGYWKKCINSVDVLPGQAITVSDLDLEQIYNWNLSFASLSGNVKLAGKSDHSGITISLAGTELSTTTNASGDYSLQYITQGEYDVIYDSPAGSGFESGITLYDKRFYAGIEEVYEDLQLNYGRKLFDTDQIDFEKMLYNHELQLAMILTSEDEILLFDNNTGEITTIGEGYSGILAVNSDWSAIVALKTEGTDRGKYYMPTDGGESTLIELPANSNFTVSKDFQTAVYEDLYRNLYSIPIAGGEPVYLYTCPTLYLNYIISNNSETVVYNTKYGAPDDYYYENDTLYSIPVEGGDPVFISSNVKDFKVSSDSTKIVYRNGQNYLYSVPIEGGEPVSLGLCPLKYYISYDSAKVVFKSDSDTFLVNIDGGTAVTIDDELPYSFPIVTEWRVYFDESDNGLHSVNKSTGDIVLLGTILDDSMYKTSQNAEYVLYRSHDGQLIRIGVDGNDKKIVGKIHFSNWSSLFPAFDDFSVVFYTSYFAKDVYNLNVAEFSSAKKEKKVEEKVEADLEDKIVVEIDNDEQDEQIEEETITAVSIVGKAKLLNVNDSSGIEILLLQGSTIIQQTETDSLGNYKFSGLETGAYSILASWADFTKEYYVTTDVNVFAHKISIADELNLTPTGDIQGTAILEGAISGNEGIQIYLAGFSYMARTNDTGNYLISNVPVGTYKLCTDMIGYEKECLDSVEVLPGQAITVSGFDLEQVDDTYLSFASLAGNVKLVGESDHSGITISLVGTDLSTTTNANGDYLLQNIPQGEYEIVLDSPAGSGFQDGVTVHNVRLYAGIDEVYRNIQLNYGKILLEVDSRQFGTKVYNKELQLTLFSVGDDQGDLMLYDNTTGEIKTIAEGYSRYFAVSPDWSTIVLNKTDDTSAGMYSMPIEGGEPTLITADVYISDVRADTTFKISKDNKMVVFVSNNEDLTSIPLAGGTPFYLHAGWFSTFNVTISDNSEMVVYVAKYSYPGEEYSRLYSISIEGENRVLISSNSEIFKVSSDSTRIVYLSGSDDLFSVPIEGGDSVLISSNVKDFTISSDSTKIVYRNDQNDLYSVPIEGGTQVYLGLCPLSYYISLDSTKVVYKKDHDIFLVDIGGGTAVIIDDESPYTDTIMSDWIVSFEDYDYKLYSTNPITGETVEFGTVSYNYRYRYDVSVNGKYLVYNSTEEGLVRSGTDGNNKRVLINSCYSAAFPAFDDFNAVLYFSFSVNGNYYYLNVAEFGNDATDTKEQVEAEIDDDEEIEDQTIATGSISGKAKLLDIDDQSGIDILLMQGSTIIQQTETDSSGDYKFSELKTGVYSITASWGDFTEDYFATTDVNVLANQNSIAEELILTPTGNLEGTATLDGAIIGNEGIQIYLAGFSYMARTDDEGNYLISHVPVGTYKLCADMLGYEKECLDSVEVLSGETVTVSDLDLEKGDDSYLTFASLAGNATLAGEEDHSGITVSLAGTELSTTTNASGDYLLEYIPQGKYDVVYDSPAGSGFENGATLPDNRFYSGMDEVYRDVQLSYGKNLLEFNYYDWSINALGGKLYNQELQLALFHVGYKTYNSWNNTKRIILFDNTTGIATTIGEEYSEIITPGADWNTIVALKTEGIYPGLYFIPIDGGEPTFVVLPGVVSTGDWSYKISKDNQMIVYRHYNELYSIPTAGGEPVYLGNVYDKYSAYRISENSEMVVYEGNDEEFYSIPITGGNSVLIDSDIRSIAISSDSTRIVYRTQDKNLYSVPVAGGDSIFIHANVEEFEISSDSKRIIYRTSDYYLYSVPITGGSSVFINSSIDDYIISSDSTRIVYSKTNDELYSVSITGGDSNLIASSIFNYQVSLDSTRIVYRTLDSDPNDLYSIPIEGGTQEYLGNCNGLYYISENSTMVVCSSSSIKFVVNIGGGSVILIEDDSPYTDPVVHSVHDWTVFCSDNKLYSVNKDGGDPILLDTNVENSTFKLSANAEYVVYLTLEKKFIRIGIDGNNRTILADLSNFGGFNDNLFFPAFDDFSTVFSLSYFERDYRHLIVAEFD